MNINSFGAAVPAPSNRLSPVPQTPPPQQAAQNRVLSRAVRSINNSNLIPQDRQLSISLDPATKMAVAKVVDQSTGEVIDQVPTEDVLRLAAYLEAQNTQQHAAQKTLG